MNSTNSAQSFPEIEVDTKLSNSFYKASILLKTSQRKYKGKRNKPYTNIPHLKEKQNFSKNISKLNPAGKKYI